MRMSRAKVKVIEELMRERSRPHWGYDLMRRTGVKSGTLYPILAQFEQAGWVRGDWELDKRVAGGPPRRAYRLTGEGEKLAAAAVEEYLTRKRQRPRPEALGEGA